MIRIRGHVFPKYPAKMRDKVMKNWYKMLAMLAPYILVKMLFASAAGKDKELNKQSAFRRNITQVLKHCFMRRTSGYMRDVHLYVKWQDKLAEYNNSVYLWHGTEDNWSPLSMASYLCDSMPGVRSIKSMKGLSHYSCLYEAAPQICRLLKNNT